MELLGHKALFGRRFAIKQCYVRKVANFPRDGVLSRIYKELPPGSLKYQNKMLRFLSLHSSTIKHDFQRKSWNSNVAIHRFFSSKVERDKDTHVDHSNLADDLTDTYYPVFSSTSKPVVIRAMVGNSAITVLKFLAWIKTGSSAMLSEAIHSLVDTGNQFLLVRGLQQASTAPDNKHQYGYGRAAYFWSLISALGMFWLGSGVTVYHGISSLLNPPVDIHVSWETWSVLGASFLIDGWVLSRAVKELNTVRNPGVGFFEYLRAVKDPFMLAVFLEDTSACAGVIIACAGIGATHITGNPFWDSLSSISIGGLLGAVAISMIRMNQRFLLGQSVEPEIELGIKTLLLSRPSIDNVYAVQSQWVGPSTFSYKLYQKAEVDFDGTYLAAKLLESYKPAFLDSKELRKDLPLLLAWYAEDVTRLVEKEVKEVEAEIRNRYPEAAFIELEPDSKDTDLRAISHISTQSERNIEREAMNRALIKLGRTLERTSLGQTSDPATIDKKE